MKRKPIQICAIPCAISGMGDEVEFHNAPTLYALCDDGTIWYQEEDQPWNRVAPIPQDDDSLYPVWLLDLPVRITNCLKSQEIYDIKEVVKLTEKEVFKIPNLGKKSIKDLKQSMLRVGLDFNMTDDQILTYDWINKFRENPEYATYFKKGPRK